MAKRNVIDRFLDKVDQDGPGGCWVWTASCRSSGYGQFYFDGAPRDAHRIAYRLFVGEVPEGLVLDHLCRVRRCVNPEHLEAVTHRTNVLRGIAPTAINARKTHCDHGHELQGANLYLRKDRPGRRQCRECSRISKRKQAS